MSLLCGMAHALLISSSLPEPPAIGSVSSSMTVDDGTDVRLNCSATGFPSPSYQWRKLDGVIPSTAIGVNSSTLLLPGIGEEGGGVYTCSATNFLGSAESSSIQITVIPPFYGKSLVVHGIR